MEEIEDTKKTFRNWLTFSSLPSLPAWIAIWLPPCVRDTYLYRLPEVSPSLFCVYFNNNICNTTYVLIWVLGYLLVILLTYRSHKTLAYYVLQGVSYCFELLWRPRRPPLSFTEFCRGISNIHVQCTYYVRNHKWGAQIFIQQLAIESATIKRKKPGKKNHWNTNLYA